MQFNDLKFELLRYGKNDDLKLSTSYVTPSFNLIEEKNNVKDLGVTLSSDATRRRTTRQGITLVAAVAGRR